VVWDKNGIQNRSDDFIRTKEIERIKSVII
jgi:hypothetical protein